MLAHAATAAAVVVSALLLARAVRRRRRSTRLCTSFPPPSFVISLARFPAKRASVVRRAAEAGLTQLSVFEAVDGRELSMAELHRRGACTYASWRLESTGFRFFDRELKWGEVGCGLSHLGVWRQIAELPAPAGGAGVGPVGLVLEDDVEFAPGFAELLRAVIDEVHALVAAGTIDEPDGCYLYRKAMRPEHDRLLPRSSRAACEGSGAAGGGTAARLLVPGFSYTTTAYLLWSRGAQKLLASGYESKLIPVDDFLALLYAEHEARPGIPRPDLDALYAAAPRLNMLAVRPNLCWARRGVSTTENSSLITE